MARNRKVVNREFNELVDQLKKESGVKESKPKKTPAKKETTDKKKAPAKKKKKE